MTLVIGYADAEIGFLVSDTLLSPEHFQLVNDVGPVNGEFHSLKIQILSESVAVAFAGNFEQAYQCVRALKTEISKNKSVDPIEWLSSREGVDDCEFLLLLIDGENPRRLVHVSAGKWFEPLRYYIGMQAEYDRYQGMRRPYAGPLTGVQFPENKVFTVPEGEKEFSVVSDAMESLSRDTVGRKHQVVGAINGCVTRVADARISKKLEYLQSIFVSNTPAESDSGYTMLASNEDARGIGIYFRTGKLGFIMPVCGDQLCVGVRSDDLKGFVEKGSKQFGMKLLGGTW